ncbi:S-adenosylmethionine tRNA ribosyltransferase [Brevibacillus panacihumi W25]|uniref:S-adenosylmethionine tRNA ribosyltransferase n=1 Tax=Brevibacillus panacihumi W25 TaxID=1408254 RepID=V6LYL9_9BACL|nr:S-adenosylmethionine:tRNA ribosyltransferase-isomerase [Brevibacillus panacihumi]EST51576.1 S-adenosylmethionine tRNA ribosyltransferase [Brevibacillus panacihumi W25]
MKVSELDFELPPKLLARRPREIDGQNRSDSRMLVIQKSQNKIIHDNIRNIGSYLSEGDLIVLNNSKTINAVFQGKNKNVGFVSVALCSQLDKRRWLATLHNTFKDNMANQIFEVGEGLEFKIIGPSNDIYGLFELELIHEEELIFLSEKYGRPIISNYTEKMWSLEYYQNEYATIPGSVELPAAGRHFTKTLLEELKNSGIEIEYITLHTGLSSMTIETEELEEHQMYSESYSISENTARKINETKEKGNKIIAIGTTVTRTLESSVNENGVIQSGSSWTNLYIYPGFEFKVIDGIVTNFHGPRTSRIALAAAMAGQSLIMDAYREAIQKEYLFYEFGDATLIFK